MVNMADEKSYLFQDGSTSEQHSSASILNSLKCKRKLNLKDYINIVMLCTINLCNGIGYGLITSFFPLKAKEKGLSLAETGIIISALPFTMIISGLIISKLILKFGARRMLLGSLLMASVAVFSFAFVMKIPSTAAFYAVCMICRCFQGIGFVTGQLCAIFIFSTDYNDRISTVMGFLEMSVASGISAGPAIGGFLYTALSFEAPLLFLGGLMILTNILTFLFLRPIHNGPNVAHVMHRFESMNQQSESFELGLKTMFKAFGVFIPFIANIAMFINVSFFDVILPSFISETFHQSPAIIGVVFLVAVGAYAMFSPLLGYILDRTNKNSLAVIIGCFLVIPGVLFIGPIPYFQIDHNIFLTAGCFVIVQISGSLMYVPVLGLCFEIMKDYNIIDNDESRGFINTAFIFAGNIGNFIGPLLGGVMSDTFGFENSGLVLAVLSITAGLIQLLFHFYRRAKNKQAYKLIR